MSMASLGPRCSGNAPGAFFTVKQKVFLLIVLICVMSFSLAFENWLYISQPIERITIQEYHRKTPHINEYHLRRCREMNPVERVKCTNTVFEI
jgi:hypothetical protein